MIQSPPQKYNPQFIESNILSFWKNNNIFQKSMDQRIHSPAYIFLEGPPTANGMPHPGHILTRVVKDLILRYQTMNNHYILRKAGWDTHGLPVEIEVEKKLGLKDKTDIEKFGIKQFNEECKRSVFTYENAWVKLTERIAFWIDMDHPYITLKNDYIESVWWSLKKAWEKNLLYKGYKVIPYCPRCGTALSAHEVAQGYKTVTDPSIFIKFKLKDEDAYFLAWTTTPWTLISNVALAVHPDEFYIRIKFHDEVIILAEDRAPILLKDQEYEILDCFKGKELEYKEYEPLFNYTKPDKKAWFVICADFVTMEDGTGIVHIAPAFGEDDYNIGVKYDLPVVQLVRLDGTFKDEVIHWKGEFVKDADPKIIKYLQDIGMLEGRKDHEHEYPFCWRCNSPLLYYAMESWFIAMSKVQKELSTNNNRIHWYPEHLQQGRFGTFINDVKDWALSRSRYWGTPLPIWTCKNRNCNHQICIGGIEELKAYCDNFPSEYDLHKPFVDELHILCPKCNNKMVRETEVIDSWYDSGSAFFAQWHYPFENQRDFEKNFPVDFISEALDQTRGWFYSLLAISTILFDKPPYKNVLALGLVLDKDNQKMSKSKRNYLDPEIIIDHEGADALRWYLFSANAPWNSTRFYEDTVKETLAKFILIVWNSYNFFATYAALDKFNSLDDPVPVDEWSLLDRWIHSRFYHMVQLVRTHIEVFEIHKAARVIEQFVTDDFSNWYLRRSRKRVWVEEKTTDKKAAYTSLHEIFIGLTKIIAPFTPFIAEEMYQNLKADNMPESVHLCDYPTVNNKMIDEKLEVGMQRIRELVEVGRSLRSKIGIKVRYPLAHATIICDSKFKTSIHSLVGLLKEELNVKQVTFERTADKFICKQVKPMYSVLGPRLKEKASQVQKVLMQMDKTMLFDELQRDGIISIDINGEKLELTINDFEIIENVKDNVARTETSDATLFLDVRLSDELEAEGFAREIVRRIQSMRKEMDLAVESQIQTKLLIPMEKQQELSAWFEYIKEETRSIILSFSEKPSGKLVKPWNIDGLDVTIGITPKDQ